MFNCGEVEALFSKELTVNIKDGTISRKIRLHITIENLITTAPLVRKELIVRLTDESDPFFLYTLNLNDDDFQSLKSQQGLLVEFPAFPQNVIDLLEQCLKEEHKDNPRFLLILSIPSRSGLDTSPAIFDVVETNPFKHLIHLSLKLLPASDANVKKFLGKSLRTLKEEKERLERRLHVAETDSQQRRSQDQENYTRLSEEFIKMETKFKTEITTKESRHRDELNAEKERLQKMHREEELRWEKEKAEQEKNYQVKISHLEDRIAHLETSNRELNDKLYKSDSVQKKLHSHITTLQEEVQQLHQKLQIANKDQAALDARCQDQSTTISRLQQKISFSEGLVRDLEQNNKTLEGERNNLQIEKKTLEEECKMKTLEINKEKESRRSVEDDAKKANEIIRNIYKTLECSDAKVRLQALVMDKQEKALEESREWGKKLEDELAITKRSLKEKEEEAAKATKSVEEMKEKLDECQKQIRTNENVIKWLNKQQNEKAIEKLRSPSDDPIPTAISSKQNLYRPSFTSLASHGIVPSTTASKYIPGQYSGIQKVNHSFKPTVPSNINVLRKDHMDASALPLPQHYFQKYGDKAGDIATSTPAICMQKSTVPSINASLNPKVGNKQKVPTTQLDSVISDELLKEPESPRSGPPPACTKIQSVR